MELLPPYENIPQQFKSGTTKWNRIFSQWFFEGLTNCRFVAKEGIDKIEAVRHISAIMRSFEPSHEHKEAGCAYLMSEFFDDLVQQV